MCIIDENEIFNKYLRQGDLKNGETLRYGEILRSVWKNSLALIAVNSVHFYRNFRFLPLLAETLVSSYGVPPPTWHSVCGRPGHPSLRVPAGYIVKFTWKHQ